MELRLGNNSDSFFQSNFAFAFKQILIGKEQSNMSRMLSLLLTFPPALFYFVAL